MSQYVSVDHQAKPRFPTALLSVLIGGVVVLAICLTWTYLSMRSVMDVGGSCADGGPYVSAQPCPGGAGFIGIAIPLGIVAGLAAAVAAINLAAPSLVMLAWAALFGSLGWNFLDYGIFRTDGTDPGWLVCGIVFWLMALPALLVMVIPRFSKLGSGMGGTQPQNSAMWWGIYAALGFIGVALGAWSFYSSR
ncbi:MAG: hypothetical protein JWR83_1061 [Aeromicrobium sp.]|nr:hypothetical protein [Aeromicrobium sp.]